MVYGRMEYLKFCLQQEMQIQIKIEEQKFKLSIGKGYNDWVWLAQYASRVYSKNIYPQGVYIPALLFIETKSEEFHPHPRQKIKYYLENYQLQIDDLTVVVKIRKTNHIFTDYQKKWEAQAFGEERYMSQTKFSYRVGNINRKKDFYFKVTLYFTINEDIKDLIDVKKYQSVYEVKLKERQVSPTESFFEGNIKLPYGNTSYKLFYLQREYPQEQYQQHQLKDHKIKAEDFKVNIQPKYVPVETINSLVNEDMKISDTINKSLQQKQLQAKKRNTNSSLCCFTFQQLWSIIQENYEKELYLKEYQESTKQRIKISIQKNLNQLYEIFFYYFIVQTQQKEKKEELSVTYQDVLHFLRDYQIFRQLRDLLNFMQFYNCDQKFKKLEDTLDVNHFGIKFPQFIAIMLRAIQFLQTSTLMLKGETFDSAVVKIIQKITEIQSQQEEFTEYRRNIRENAKIISFMRTNCEQLKKIFHRQAETSIQNSASDYCLKKEQVKRMLQIVNLSQKNIDLVVQECFNQLKLREDGIFYYQFLNIIQWIAITSVSSEKQAEDLDNEEEQSEIIVQKMKHLIGKIIVHL